MWKKNALKLHNGDEVKDKLTKSIIKLTNCPYEFLGRVWIEGVDENNHWCQRTHGEIE